MNKVKKIFLFLLILFCHIQPCFSEEKNQILGVSADLGIIQDLFLKHHSNQFSLSFRYAPDSEFEFRLPLTLTNCNNQIFLDGAIFVCYYPFKIKTGLFFGISLIHFGREIGKSNNDTNFTPLNEMAVGWNITIPLGFFIEPVLLIRDPSGTFSDEYSSLRGSFDSYSTFRARLNVGWKYKF